jgi:hypothetical protein
VAKWWPNTLPDLEIFGRERERERERERVPSALYYSICTVYVDLKGTIHFPGLLGYPWTSATFTTINFSFLEVDFF